MGGLGRQPYRILRSGLSHPLYMLEAEFYSREQIAERPMAVPDVSVSVQLPDDVVFHHLPLGAPMSRYCIPYGQFSLSLSLC
jgi:hypothetical protein